MALAIPLAIADKRPPAQRGRVFPDLGVRVIGIRAAVEVQVVRVPVIQPMVAPVCSFRFWVAIFTGAVAVEDPDIPSVVETVELEEEVVERSIPPRGELG